VKAGLTVTGKVEPNATGPGKERLIRDCEHGIRLGRGRRRAVSLLDDEETEVPEPETTAVVDWRRIIKGAQLTRLEARAFLHHWRRGVPVYRLHDVLGCRPAEVQRAVQSVRYKLRNTKPALAEYIALGPLNHSLNPVYRDRLGSGARPWSLAELSPDFRSIMDGEKKYIHLVSQPPTGTFEKSQAICPIEVRGLFSPMKQDEDLQATLRQAKSQLDKHEVASQAIEREISTLEDALTRLQNSDDATLLSDSFPERLRAAKQAVTQAEAKAQALRVVITRQRGVVEAIEAKIASRKYEDFDAVVGPLEAKMYASLEQFLKDSVELAECYGKFNDLAVSRPVFKPIDPSDPHTHHLERLQALALFQSAVHHVRYREATRVAGYRWHAA